METITAFIRAAQELSLNHLLIVLLCGTGLFLPPVKGCSSAGSARACSRCFPAFPAGEKAGKQHELLSGGDHRHRRASGHGNLAGAPPPLSGRREAILRM
ncbi:MAG: hypothetical protein ACLRXC_08160 [[Clostridium] leptum]